MAVSIDTLQSTALGYAQGFVTDAKAALTDAATAIQNIDTGAVDYAIPLAQAFKEPDKISRPVLHSVKFDLPTEPALPDSLRELSDLTFDPIPVFNAVAPELELPSRPSEIGAFNGVAPQIVLDTVFPELPAALSNFDFAPPVIPERSAPVRPEFAIPDFEAPAPEGGVGSLGDLSAKFLTSYREAAPEMMSVIEQRMDAMLTKYNPRYFTQLEQIEAQLAKYMAGGTGFKASIENQFQERARDKINAEYQRALALSETDSAKRGFSIPPGALMSARQALRKDAGDNISRAAVEMSIKQAEIEQANLQFAVTQSSQLRTQMLANSIQHEQAMITVNGQAIEAAKDITQFIIDAFNSEVKRVELDIQVFQARVALFEQLMKRSQLAVDIYRAEISALEGLATVDNLKIAVYNSRINGLQALAGLFKTQVDAVVSKAELQKIKVDLFRAEVETYSARVSAKNSEYQAYSAALAGEEAKFKIYETQAGVFSQRISGYRATIESKTAQLSAQVQRNDAIIKQYQAQVGAFSTVVGARAEVARNDLDNQRLNVVAYQAEASAAVAEAQSRASYYASVNQVGIEQARLFTQQSLDRAKLKLTKTTSIAGAVQTLGATYQSAASSAMAGTLTFAGATENASV